MLSTTILFAGLAAAITAIPTAVERVDNTLPWEITWFNANKYSPKSHNARINITLSDPNETRLQQTPTGYAVFPKFEANCHWSWDWFEDPFPFDKVTVCTPLGSDDIYGNLTMTLRDIGEEEPSPGSVDVDIVESRSVIVLGTQYVRVWNGTLHLRSGENTRLRCALGSGQCGWNLQNRPVLVQPQLIESLGSCETADIGGC